MAPVTLCTAYYFVCSCFALCPRSSVTRLGLPVKEDGDEDGDEDESIMLLCRAPARESSLGFSTYYLIHRVTAAGVGRSASFFSCFPLLPSFVRPFVDFAVRNESPIRSTWPSPLPTEPAASLRSAVNPLPPLVFPPGGPLDVNKYRYGRRYLGQQNPRPQSVQASAAATDASLGSRTLGLGCGIARGANDVTHTHTP